MQFSFQKIFFELKKKLYFYAEHVMCFQKISICFILEITYSQKKKKKTLK